MGLIKGTAPSIPIPQPAYSQDQQQQRDNALRLYFNQIDNGNWDGTKVVAPYGSFFSTATQTAASTTTAYPITFSNTDSSNNITLSNSSRLNVAYAGIYNLEFSLQLSNLYTAPIDINVWLRKNGVDVANSNSLFGLAARKGPTDPFHNLGALNLFVQLSAKDYIELVWCTSDVNGTIKYLAAQASPTRPATPSVIATLSWVSALP